MLSFRVPHQQLLSRLAGRVPRTGVGVKGSGGVGGAVSALMTALWRVEGTMDNASLRDLEQSCVASLAAATAARDEGPMIDRTALRAAVMQHVRDHLTDRTLSVSSVARRFAISPRTLHYAFAGSDDSFAATVRVLRLDSCAALLADRHAPPLSAARPELPRLCS